MNQRHPQSRHTPHGGSEKSRFFHCRSVVCACSAGAVEKHSQKCPPWTLDGLKSPSDPLRGGGGGWTLDLLCRPTHPPAGGGWTLDLSGVSVGPVRCVWNGICGSHPDGHTFRADLFSMLLQTLWSEEHPNFPRCAARGDQLIGRRPSRERGRPGARVCRRRRT